ncbi:MAG: Fic family protein [Gammaproteobacteria bacterium]|nr:Fic family protein [Gammaproteobacteria bacterium]
MPTTVRWQSVSDIPDNWQDLVNPELGTLRDVWLEQAAALRDSQALKDFNARLAREWAIETGVLEKLYTIDQGVSRLLVEQGLQASLLPHGSTDQDRNYVLRLIQDQHQVVEWLFDFVKNDRQVSTSFIKEMHQLMTRHQDATDAQDQFGQRVKVALERGAWRKQPTKVERLDSNIYECCLPEHIAAAMDELIRLFLGHARKNVPAEVQAAWLHHRFTEIHPFQDGNGRVARSLATLAFLRDGYFPLVVRGSDRNDYLYAIYAADAGNLAPLVDLFGRLQKRAFVDALGISREVLHEQASLEEIAAAAADRLHEVKRERERRMTNVFGFADKLWALTRTRLQAAATTIGSRLAPVNPAYRAWSDSAANETERDGYHRFQVIEGAKQLGYFANTRTYRSWVRLSILTDSQTDILFSFHCLGSEFRGVMAVAPLIYRRARTGDDSSPAISEIETIAEEPFLLNYNDIPAALEARFSQWLDKVLAVGLDRWRRSL